MSCRCAFRTLEQIKMDGCSLMHAQFIQRSYGRTDIKYQLKLFSIASFMLINTTA